MSHRLKLCDVIIVVDSRGLVVLDGSGDIDKRFGGKMNDIRLEAEFLEETQN